MNKTDNLAVSSIQRRKDENTIPCIVLCAAIVLVFGFAPLLSARLTQPIRPIVIITCLLMPASYVYRANKTIKIFAVYIFYMTIVFLLHNLTKSSFMAWMSAILFATFFIVVSQRIWSKREIRLIFIATFLASLFYSVLLHYYNNDLFHHSGELFINHTEINSNAAAYSIGPGALCGVVLLLGYKNKTNRMLVLYKVLLLASVAFMFYTLVCLGQRSAFFSFVIGTILVLWEKTGTSPSKSNLRLLLILVVILSLFAAPRLTEGTHAERLFDYAHLLDDNGRDELNTRAKELIKEKPVLGGGYDYWDQESGEKMGLHNGFYLIMVTGGFIAGILISFFFLNLFVEISKSRSLIPIAFIICAAAHMFTDSGLDYFSYIPMILAYIMVRNARFRNVSVSEIMIR